MRTIPSSSKRPRRVSCLAPPSLRLASALLLAAGVSLASSSVGFAGDEEWEWTSSDVDESVTKWLECPAIDRVESPSGWTCPGWFKHWGSARYDAATGACQIDGKWKVTGVGRNPVTGVVRSTTALETVCRKGRPVGPTTISWPSGKVRERREYDTEGRAHGKYELYRSDGRLLEKGTLCDPEAVSGSEPGVLKENGGVDSFMLGRAFERQRAAARKGSDRGALIQPDLDAFECGASLKHEYHDSGVLAKEEPRLNGVPHGVTVEYDGDGKVWSRKTYKATEREGIMVGLLHGASTVYWSNGKVKEKETYFEGVLRGPYESFFEDGTLWLKGAACEDRTGAEPWVKCGPGFQLELWPNGNLKARVNSSDGMLLGNAEYRFESGALDARGKNCPVPGTKGLACGVWEVGLDDGQPPSKACYLPAPLTTVDVRVEEEIFSTCPPKDGTVVLTTAGSLSNGVFERWEGSVKRGLAIGLWTELGSSRTVCLDKNGRVAEDAERCASP
ncbi:MAG: hypothetical protein FJ096_10125 [Deltaproteobacteria bacterium]|nr:hypothetical protein [Deltaproteobacteria bacterium]